MKKFKQIRDETVGVIKVPGAGSGKRTEHKTFDDFKKHATARGFHLDKLSKYTTKAVGPKDKPAGEFNHQLSHGSLETKEYHEKLSKRVDAYNRKHGVKS